MDLMVLCSCLGNIKSSVWLSSINDSGNTAKCQGCTDCLRFKHVTSFCNFDLSMAFLNIGSCISQEWRIFDKPKASRITSNAL